MTRLRTYAQLVRLPNLPSALADICLGALAAGALPQRWLPFLLLATSSAFLYCGGMVWNDFFDVEQDKRERPQRPIPSGRVSLQEAGRLGAVLIVAGILFALLAGLVVGMTPAIVAALLIVAIFFYDAWLKRTPLGPVGMGLCRFFNVLLAVSVSGTLLWRKEEPLGVYLALIVGLYIVGVTWFARTEARRSNQWALAGALTLMLLALVLSLLLPLYVEPPGTTSVVFPYLLVIVGFAVGLPAAKAVSSPTPEHVQAGVKRALMGLVLLDATLASALAGTWGLVILLLLAPSLYLNRKRWLYAT